jgi:hypothetical protein
MLPFPISRYGKEKSAAKKGAASHFFVARYKAANHPSLTTKNAHPKMGLANEG